MAENHEPITLDTLAEKIDTVASTVDKLVGTVDALAAITKAGFDDVYSRMDGIEAALTEKIDAVDASLRVEIKTSREEMRQGFASVHQTLGDHEERITTVERELAP
jgi:hypothetical protein